MAIGCGAERMNAAGRVDQVRHDDINLKGCSCLNARLQRDDGRVRVPDMIFVFE